MSLAKVTLTGTLPGAAGASWILTPSEWLTDAADELMIPPVPVNGRLTSNSDSSGSLSIPGVAANDNPGPMPAGSAWTLAFADIPGVARLSFTFRVHAAPFAFTATQASPAVFTAPGTGYPAGQAVILSGGSLPGGFTAGPAYYVTAVSGSTFSLAAARGGTPLASSSAGSGTIAGPAAQDISTLVQVQPSAAMAAYLTGSYPGGTSLFLAASGQWLVPPVLGDLDGGSAADVSLAVLAIDGGSA